MKLLTSNKGQAIVEMVLLLTAMVAVSYLVLDKFFKGSQKTESPIYLFIAKPWVSIGGMIESGTWKSRNDALSRHPNYWHRMQTQEGTTPP